MNVLVFPTCNEPGLEIIQALSKSNKIHLFGGSSDKGDYDPARHFLQHYLPLPHYQAPGFKEDFQRICRDYAIDAVIPAWDPLVEVFSEWRMENTVFITPRPEIAHLLMSKSATYARLKGIVPVPVVYSHETAPRPVFAKPDRDSGSRNIMHVQTPEQLHLAKAQGMLLCEYLPGPEYTVDCISDREGRLLFANARLRANIGRGIALGTRTVHDPHIQESIERIAGHLRIEGPWFAQFKENAQGEPVLIEINARVGGSMTLTRLSGVNIPLIAVFMYTGHPVRVPQPRSEIVLNRCLRNFAEPEPFEWAIWDWDDTLLRKDGKPDPESIACLYDLNNRGVRQLLLSKNADAPALLQQHRLPDFFVEVRCAEDKAGALAEWFERYHIAPSRCIVINDSYAELFLLQERFPELRILSPDALEYLGREKIG